MASVHQTVPEDLPDYEDGEQVLETKGKGGDDIIRGNYASTQDVSFTDFYLKAEIERGISDAGFENPSEVQVAAIPQAITGVDILCQAKSGMGKTAVFVLSILQQIPYSEDGGEHAGKHVYCLSVAHTRELAYQIKSEFDRFSNHITNLNCGVVIGGCPYEKDVTQLKNPETAPQILIGTPGRLKELLTRNHLNVEHVAHFVLDECDKCLEDLAMRRDVQTIFMKCPKKKQVMFFTATLTDDMKALCRKFMDNPIEIFIDPSELTLHGLVQFYKKVEKERKNRVLGDIMDLQEFNQAIIFVNSCRRAESLANLLRDVGFPAVSMHKDLKQQERLARYSDFKAFKTRILVATDVLARGIDIERVNLVFNYDAPTSADTYLHRVGRAGRFGTKGLTVTFIESDEDKKVLDEIQKRFVLEIPEYNETVPYEHYS